MFASVSYRPAELHNHFLLQLPRMKTSSQWTVIVAPKTPCDLFFFKYISELLYTTDWLIFETLS